MQETIKGIYRTWNFLKNNIEGIFLFSALKYELLTWFILITLENIRCRSGVGRTWRTYSESKDAPLVQTTVVVVQVAGVKASVRRLQVRDIQWKVPQRKSVLRDAHLAQGKEGSVFPLLPRAIQVHQSVGLVRTDSRGLEVPVGHLLLVLLDALPPQGVPVYTRQHNRAAQQDHKHSLLSIPVPFLFPS